MEITIEKEFFTLQDLFDGKVKRGDYLIYKDELYRFDGYEYGTYPIATNVETDEQIELPYY